METLTFVGHYTTKKDGSPLVGGNGKPYTSVRIKTNEHGDKFMSGFGNAETKTWKVGDKVEIEVEQNGDYLNFSSVKKATPAGMSDETTRKIMSMLETILTEVKMIRGQGKPPMFPEIPEGHTTSSSMPQFHTEDMDQERIDAENIPW